jgi:hypothetical protein
LVFTAKDGTTVGLAAPSGDRKLKPGDFRRMSHMEGWQQTFYMIEKVASPKALAISDNLRRQDYADMMKAWTEWSWHHGGGILSALLILKDHWGAVGRDLAVADTRGTKSVARRLPLDQFVRSWCIRPAGDGCVPSC